MRRAMRTVRRAVRRSMRWRSARGRSGRSRRAGRSITTRRPRRWSIGTFLFFVRNSIVEEARFYPFGEVFKG